MAVEAANKITEISAVWDFIVCGVFWDGGDGRIR
jgi:hypothetical protein